MQELISWARDHGASFEAVPHPQHPRQLFAARDLTPGEVIFSIPEPLLLYGARAYADTEYGPAFRQLQEEAGPVLDQRCLLVLLLVLERCRGQGSFFAPYCNILPATYDDPFWWSESELALLQGTRLHKAVGHYTAGLHQLHGWLLRLEQIHQQQHEQQQQQAQQQQAQQEQQQEQRRDGGTLSTAAGGWGLTSDAVKWARSAVWSRAFTIKGLDISSNRLGLTAGSSQAAQQDMPQPVEGVTGPAVDAAAAAAAAGDGGDGGALAPFIALVPVLDMCDHHQEQRVSWRTVTLGDDDQHQQQQNGTEKQQQQELRLQAFQFTSLSPVAKGAELLNNYGTTKPNEELLLGFGFVLDQNPNDSFLVTISHPPVLFTDPDSKSGAAEGDEDGSGGEEACDVAAVWQRRLAAMAAAGLQLDVPITTEHPLPAKLLGVMLVAAALPACELQASTLLPPAPAAGAGGRAEAAAVAGSSDPGQGSAAGTGLSMLAQQQQQQLARGVLLFESAPLRLQLEALCLLQQQLSAKLQGMLPPEHLLQHLQGTSAAQQQQGLNPSHARMAAVYVLSQQQLLQQALEAVTQLAGTCLHQQVTRQLLPAGATAAAAAGGAAAASLAGVNLHEQLQLCPRCHVLSVHPGCGDIPAGSVLFEAALSSCVAADSETDLTLQLMLLAAEHQQHAELEQPPEQQQESEPAGSYFGSHWQQQQQQQDGGLPPFASVLPWWLVASNQDLGGVLAETPAGQQLQQVSGELQEDFSSLISSVQAGAAVAAAAAEAPDGSNAAASEASQRQRQQQQQRVLELVRPQPQEAFRMFCWAQQLVKHSAVQLQQQQQEALLLLVPGLELVPRVMCDLLLSIQLAADTDRQPSQQQQVLVSSRAALPAGTRFCSEALAAGSNAQQLLLEQGPAAVAAAASAAASAAAAAAAAAADLSKAPRGSSSSRSSVEGSGVLRHVYELMLLPPEGDPLRHRKLQLLSATGLGLCHYLTDCQKGVRDSSNSNSSNGAEPEQQQQESARAVLSAMALCLLSAEDPVHVQLLSPDRIQAVAQEQQRLLRAAGVLGISAVSAGAVLDAPTEAAATDASMPAGGDGVGSSRVWAELQEQVLQQTGKEARKQLLLVLKEDRKAVKAAQQELQEQEEEEQAAGDGQCCCCGGGAVSAAQGVGVYLVGQMQVLDRWVGLLQGSGVSSSGSKKSKKKEAAADDGRKKHKQQKRAARG